MKPDDLLSVTAVPLHHLADHGSSPAACRRSDSVRACTWSTSASSISVCRTGCRGSAGRSAVIRQHDWRPQDRVIVRAGQHGPQVHGLAPGLERRHEVPGRERDDDVRRDQGAPEPEARSSPASASTVLCTQQRTRAVRRRTSRAERQPPPVELGADPVAELGGPELDPLLLCVMALAARGQIAQGDGIVARAGARPGTRDGRDRTRRCTRRVARRVDDPERCRGRVLGRLRVYG